MGARAGTAPPRAGAAGAAHPPRAGAAPGAKGRWQAGPCAARQPMGGRRGLRQPIGARGCLDGHGGPAEPGRWAQELLRWWVREGARGRARREGGGPGAPRGGRGERAAGAGLPGEGEAEEGGVLMPPRLAWSTGLGDAEGGGGRGALLEGPGSAEGPSCTRSAAWAGAVPGATRLSRARQRGGLEAARPAQEPRGVGLEGAVGQPAAARGCRGSAVAAGALAEV